MQRVRQFGDLRQSRQKSNLNQSSISHKALYTPKQEFETSSKASSTQSYYVCLNCQNHNLSQQKHRHQRQRENLQRSRYAELEKSRRVQEDHLHHSLEKKLEQDKQRLLDENKRIIEQRNKSKERERLATEAEKQKENQILKQHQKMAEQLIAQKQLKKNNLRDSLEKQIEEKNQTRLRLQMEDRYPRPVQDEEDPDGVQAAQKRLTAYKEGLLEQIRANDDKKRQSRYQNDNDKSSFALLKLAEQRAKQMMADQNRRKVQFQEEIKQLAKTNEQKRIAQQLKTEQERVQALINQQFQQKLCLQNEKARLNKIQNYKYDIKKQMQEKQKQRVNERLRDKYSTGYLNMSLKELEKRLCDSCDKTFPKTYLTRYKRKK